MKSILKFLPVALGVLTMASCSNEDFFGSEAQKNGKELIPTVENLVNADGGTTRNAISGDGTYSISWQEGDVFRVYDEAVQAYDIFSKKAAGITIDGDADVEAHKYALYPGNKVSYAGWDKTNGVSAVMLVDKSWEYGGAKKATFDSGEKTVYATSLPMWGPVTDETSENLKTPLNYLTSVLDVCVYQKAANKIRVVAFKDKASKQISATLTAANFASEAGKETPLSGYFFAQLKDEGQLVKDMTQPNEMKNVYGYTLEVTVPAAKVGDEAHVLIPIIPATYKYLSVQYSADNGTNWTELKGYEETVFERKQIRKTGLEIGNAPITAVVSSLKDLNDKLQIIANTTDYQNRTVNITATGDIKTTQALAQLTIPTMTTDQIVNFNFPIDDTDNPLTIAGGTSGKTMTINLNQGISGNTAVTINTSGNLVLTGSINSSRGDQYKKLTIEGGNVTLGSSADFNSFSTNMDVVAKKNLVIDAVEGEIANVELSATNNPTLQIKTGKVTKVASASTGTITIDGGEVATIEQAADGNVVIGAAKVGTLEAKPASGTLSFTTTVKKGAMITNLYLSKSSGVVKITDASVTTLQTNAADVLTTGSTPTIATKGVTIESKDADATVGTLKIYQAVNIDLVGDTGDDAYTAKISTLSGNSKKATVSSTGKAVISTASSLASGSSFTSEWNDTKIATTDITSGNIYTAAQLAGIKDKTNYTLKTNITSSASAAWTPVNLSGNFTAESLSVTVKGAPLFNKISGTAVVGGSSSSKVMTLETGNITGAEDENNLGSLAKEVDGTVTVQFVKANAGTTGTSATGVTIQGYSNAKPAENIGGLIGKASGTITLQDIQLGKNTALTLKGHANVGGFIGNVASGTVKILTSQEWKSKIDFVEHGTYATLDVKAGTFGNFIGSITGAGVSVDIHSTKTTPTNNISSFFDLTSNGIRMATSGSSSTPTLTPNLNFGKNYIEDGGVKKYYKGMIGNSGYTSQALTFEIGYSPVTTVGTIYLYNTTTDTLGNPVSIGLSDINQFK